MRKLVLAAAFASAMPIAPLAAQEALVPVAADTEKGTITLTLPAPDAEGIAGRYLYVAQIETGVGSAATGVDRGAPLRTGILRFRRAGGKVVAELENTKFVAPAGSEAQQASIANSFSNATMWVGDIEETAEDGSFSFDFAGFLGKDHFGFASQLGEGYSLQADYSVADPAKVKAFPENVEFSALLSFTSKTPDLSLRNVSPNGSDISLWVRHSLVELPEDPMPRRTDPYGFAFFTQTYDFSAPLGQSMLVQMAERHRLEKVDPDADRSPVKEPIVYYVDGAAPEPVRQALIDGVGWWAEAFEEAGFIDAFRVEILPPDVDPFDMRYNVVNWVNRATRGWSYGPSIVDPRTGRNPQGQRDARLVASAAGHSDLSGTDGSGVDQYRRSQRSGSRRPCSHPPAGRARGWPHARPRSQFRCQHAGPLFCNGLSRTARGAGRWRDLDCQCLWRRRGRVGQVCDPLSLRGEDRRRSAGHGPGGARLADCGLYPMPTRTD